MPQPLIANKSMVQIPILFVLCHKNIYMHRMFCSFRMHILTVGTNLTKLLNLPTEKLVCSYNILAVEEQLLMSPGQHQVARHCSCPDLKIK